MNLPNLYTKINENNNIKDRLERFCDLIIVDVNDSIKYDYEDFNTSENLLLIALNGAGDNYFLMENNKILYVSSEGEYSIISKSFDLFIALITSYPFWYDILHSSDYNLNTKYDLEFNKYITFLESEYVEDNPDFLNILKDIRNIIGVKKDKQVISDLFELKELNKNIKLYSKTDNTKYDSM